MNQSNSDDISLPSWGKGIGHFHTGLYAFCLIYNTRQMVFHSKCLFPMPFYGCIGLEIVLLIMVGASACISDGIKEGKAMTLIPWLFLTLLVVVACSVLLFFIHKPHNIAVGLILATSILTWYPILKLYQDMSADDDFDPTGAVLASYEPYAPVPPNATEQQALSGGGGGYPQGYNAMQNIPGSNPLQGNVMYYAAAPAPQQYYASGPCLAYPPGPYQCAYNAVQNIPGNNPVQASTPYPTPQAATEQHPLAAGSPYPPAYNIIQDIPGANPLPGNANSGPPAGPYPQAYNAAQDNPAANPLQGNATPPPYYQPGPGANPVPYNVIQDIPGANPLQAYVPQSAGPPTAQHSQPGPGANPAMYNIIQDIPGANPLQAYVPQSAGPPTAQHSQHGPGANPATYNVIQDIPGANPLQVNANNAAQATPSPCPSNAVQNIPGANSLQDNTPPTATAQQSQTGPGANPPAYNVIQDIPGANPLPANANNAALADEMDSKINRDANENEKNETKNH